MNFSKIKKSIETIINESHPYVKNFFRVSVAVFVFGFLLASSVYLMPSTKTVRAQEPEQVASSGKSNNKSILEVHIADNGMVYIQGARVVSVSGKIMVVSTAWNHMDLKWTIQTNASSYGKRHFGTSFLDSKGKEMDMKYIRVGDFITISGVLDMNSKETVIKADVVRI